MRVVKVPMQMAVVDLRHITAAVNCHDRFISIIRGSIE